MEQDNKYIRSLIESAKQGKVVALEELYRMNIERIYAIIFRMTADKPLACLLTHNVLITAWKNIGDISEDISISDWLRMVAVNLTYHELKSGKLKKNKKKLKPFITENSSDEFYSEPLEKTIADLKYDARALIVLNRIEQFSSVEIDNLIDIPEEEAKKILIGGMSEIEKSFANIEPGSVFINSIEELPREIKPDIDIVHYTMNRIREAKEEEFKEVEVEVEEIKKISTGKVKVEKEKKERKKLKLNKKYIVGVLSVSVVLLVAYYYLTSKVIWKAEIKTGSVLLNDSRISESENFNNDDILKTDKSSGAMIIIPDVGKIEVKELTTVERLGDNYLKLTQGKLIIDTRGETGKLLVQVPSAVIDEYYLSDNYLLQVDERGNSEIKVYSGWLEIKSGEESSIIPEGYSVEILKDAGVGVPYLSGSELTFRKLIEEYIFGGKNPAVLDNLLSATSTADAITLWNLLRRVKPNQRTDVYEKLSELVPFPKEVTKDDIINLDANALQLWLDEIEWLM